MTPSQAEELEIARNHRERLSEFLDSLDVGASMPEEELSAIGSIAGLADVMLPSVSEATRQGWAGVIADDLAVVRSWGFALNELDVPLWLWHGDRDELAPLHHSTYFAEQVGSARLDVCAGEGHIAMFRHQADVLRALGGE